MRVFKRGSLAATKYRINCANIQQAAIKRNTRKLRLCWDSSATANFIVIIYLLFCCFYHLIVLNCCCNGFLLWSFFCMQYLQFSQFIAPQTDNFEIKIFSITVFVVDFISILWLMHSLGANSVTNSFTFYRFLKCWMRFNIQLYKYNCKGTRTNSGLYNRETAIQQSDCIKTIVIK